MFTHILVPLDGSRIAEVVLPDALALAQRLNARLTLLHITEKRPPAEVHGESHLTSTPAAEAYLGDLAASLSAGAAPAAWHVHPADQRGVAQMIADQATELHADLIVLSTHGAGLREQVLGSIAQQVVREGRAPVLLSRRVHHATVSPHPVEHVLVPLDGEPVHEVAIAAAEAIARAWQANVHLVNVVPTMETVAGQEAQPGVILPNAMRTVLDLAAEGGLEYLERLRQRLAVPATAAVLRGDPARMIATEAERVRADLIVMATHGRMGLSAFWEASVAPKVLRDATGPLLLLRAPDA